jgi:2'-5' RNA ligase
MAFADLAPGQHADQVHNHWWWRPGWTVGRRYYAFHVTFDGAKALHDLAGTYRNALAELAPPHTPVPDRWLHLTMQGIGFTDEVSSAQLASVTDAARTALSQAPPSTTAFHFPIVADEAIAVPAEPDRPLVDIRLLLRRAVAEAAGQGQPAEADKFRPHVSVAYLTTSGPSEPYIAAIRLVSAPPAVVDITHIDLIEMHRDNLMYEWTIVDRLPIA